MPPDAEGPIATKKASLGNSSANSRFLGFFQDNTNLYIVFGLAIACFLLYGQVFSFEFLNLDDNGYIYENPFVAQGLNWASIKWAFTAFYYANWHPLTWLSHQLDVSIFGLKAGGHHIVNVLFHTVNSILLFMLLKRLTNSTWRSAVVAAIFAVHPTHVESVAWVAERKDVLSTLFWFLSTYFYICYAKESNGANKLLGISRNYLFTFFFFALGSMAKPMLVTLPFTLLLLDYWALERFKEFNVKSILPLVKEKIPLFGLTVLSAVITLLAQKTGGAVETLENIPIATRIMNSLVSYAKYVGMLFYPSDLGLWYPYQHDLPLWQVIVSIIVVSGISLFCIWQLRGRKYLALGWFWFLGTLVPVIGLLQVGGQALADRYTYVPYIGLSIAVIWLAADLLKSIDKKFTLGFAAVILAGFSFLTFKQVSYWQNNETIFTQTLSVTKGNFLIEQNLCHHLLSQNRLDEAETQCLNSIQSQPNYNNSYLSLGIIYFKRNNYDQAARKFSKALELKPDDFAAFSNLSKALIRQGKLDEAAQMTEKIEKEAVPNSFSASVLLENYNTLGMSYAQKGEYAKSALFLRKSLEITPSNADTRANFGFMLHQAGKTEEGIKELQESLRQNPGKAETHNMLGMIYLSQGKQTEAIAEFEKAVELRPEWMLANDNLQRARGVKK